MDQHIQSASPKGPGKVAMQ